MLNFLISIFGWLAFNFALFSMEKDEYDEKDQEFPISKYIKKHWDNWLGSLFVIPLILYIGYKQLSLNPLSPIDFEQAHWSDLYYMSAGFAFEFLKVSINKIKKWKNENS